MLYRGVFRTQSNIYDEVFLLKKNSKEKFHHRWFLSFTKHKCTKLSGKGQVFFVQSLISAIIASLSGNLIFWEKVRRVLLLIVLMIFFCLDDFVGKHFSDLRTFKLVSWQWLFWNLKVLNLFVPVSHKLYDYLPGPHRINQKTS